MHTYTGTIISGNDELVCIGIDNNITGSTILFVIISHDKEGFKPEMPQTPLCSERNQLPFHNISKT